MVADPSDEGAAPTSSSPVWGSPGEFGLPAATDMKTGVATPLLAGFSIALLASIGQAPTSFRWPGATIFVLVLAIGSFVLSIQLGFRSRSKLYSRADALSWGQINQLPTEQDEKVRAQVQRRHMAIWQRSQRPVQLSYNLAVATLALAVSLAAAPPGLYGNDALASSERAWRWSASSLGLVFTMLQIGWILRDERMRRANVQRAIRLGGANIERQET